MSRYLVSFVTFVEAADAQDAANFAATTMHLPIGIEWGATVEPDWALYLGPFRGLFMRTVRAHSGRPPTTQEVAARVG